MKYLFALILLLLLPLHAMAAGDHTLTIRNGTQVQKLAAAALLKRADAVEVTIENDGSYNKTMHYRAVPLAALLKDIHVAPGSVVEAVATDGFVAQLPLDLLLQTKKDTAKPFLAIEPPDAPWPLLPGKKASAGPFYIIWQNPAASGVRSEQWPFMVVELRTADSPAKRWKELAVDDALPADSPIRAGQALFATQCMSCHKLNGAGSAEVGPDLNRPLSPTEYFQPDALKKYIRDPASIRHWPNMQMPGFKADALSDREIDLIIAYLQHMAARRK